MKIIGSILVVFALLTGDPVQYRLIAHRGGVVENLHPENSPASVAEAIERGYWMVEVDIRETKDGKAIVQHDPDFQRFYNDPRRVEEMTLAEVKKLRSKPGNEAPLTLEEMLRRCQQGNLKLMLDTKAPHSEGFLSQIESTLKQYDLLASAYVIGTEASRRYFMGKAKVGAPRGLIQKAKERGEDIGQHYFLFEHGNELDKEIVRWAQENQLTVVPSVNKFHYGDSASLMQDAKDDIQWLKASGVTEFQIDSEFDRWFDADDELVKQ